jgi:DNA-binding CsgD family transcriptional regulator
VIEGVPGLGTAKRPPRGRGRAVGPGEPAARQSLNAAAPDVDELVRDGRAALDAGEWAAARVAFEACLQAVERPDALLGLSDALWWLGETDGAVRRCEEAYAGFRRSGDAASAIVAAVTLYFHQRVSLGNASAARGWLGRAARLVEEHGLAALEGWVMLMRAHDAGDPAVAERWARGACDLAGRHQDPDLELCALSQLGVALVELGRVDEGGTLLDEAMAASLAGECDSLRTVVYTNCNMIAACGQVVGVDRATAWIRAADEFTRRYGSPHLYTTCRIAYGGVLFATGDWPQAERELRAALDSARSADPALHGEAVARLAELRVAQGRLDEAERLMDGFEDHPIAARVIAALRLDRGDLAAAATMLRRRLRDLEEPARITHSPVGASASLERAALLELLAHAQLKQDAGEDARATAKLLTELGARAGCELIVAQAARATGRALSAVGLGEAALPELERALAIYARLGLRFEAARTHLAIAGTLLDGSAAICEGRTALTTFEQLGAGRAADEAAALLRSLGETAARRTSVRGNGSLTRREREVLELLAEGLSNREIAARLFLTRKTVEHHVRSVLRKLGLRSRAHAAAYAVRHLERDSAQTSAL